MRSSLMLLPLMALGACTVGPDYQGPSTAGAPTVSQSFARTNAATETAAPAVATWWTGLGDPTLDALETKALAANPSLAVAQARLKQARSTLRLDKANDLPNANAQVMSANAKLPDIEVGDTTVDSLNFYNLGFDASWEIDLFGGRRRTVEASQASLQAAEASLADAQVSLTAEVASAYVNLRDRQHRLAFAEQSAVKQRDILALTQQRFTRGTVSAMNVERQRTSVEQAEAALLPLQAERDAYLNALATLTGEAPGAVDALLSAPSSLPLPPAMVAVGDPTALLQRRPDIRAAERKLAAATAKIGVAEAARFPRISFMGLIGIGGTTPGDMFDPDNLAAIAMPSIKWNLFDFGRNSARIGQAEGARDEAEAQYRQTVLTALRDAEDSLSRFGSSRLAVASAARTKASADRNAVLIRQRFDAGASSRIDLLDAERQVINADQSLTQATAKMTADYIALQKALGLGWSGQ